MKTISIFLALLNSVIAGLLLAASLTGAELHEAALLWLLTKITAGSVVILIGALSWLAGMRALAPGVLPLSSLFLTASARRPSSGRFISPSCAATWNITWSCTGAVSCCRASRPCWGSPGKREA